MSAWETRPSALPASRAGLDGAVTRQLAAAFERREHVEAGGVKDAPGTLLCRRG